MVKTSPSYLWNGTRAPFRDFEDDTWARREIGVVESVRNRQDKSRASRRRDTLHHAPHASKCLSVPALTVRQEHRESLFDNRRNRRRLR